MYGHGQSGREDSRHASKPSPRLSAERKCQCDDSFHQLPLSGTEETIKLQSFSRFRLWPVPRRWPVASSRALCCSEEQTILPYKANCVMCTCFRLLYAGYSLLKTKNVNLLIYNSILKYIYIWRFVKLSLEFFFF